MQSSIAGRIFSICYVMCWLSVWKICWSYRSRIFYLWNLSSITVKSKETSICLSKLYICDYGSCDLFQSYQLESFNLNEPLLKDQILDRGESNEKDDSDDDNDDADIDTDYYAPGTIVAVPSIDALI